MRSGKVTDKSKGQRNEDVLAGSKGGGGTEDLDGDTVCGGISGAMPGTIDERCFKAALLRKPTKEETPRRLCPEAGDN